MGKNVRNILPVIPDFTSLAWQMSQTEIAIVNQIDFGSAPLMPAWRYKLTREQVLSLAVYIRSFPARPAGDKATVPPPSRLTAKYIYGTFCYACHDTNGKGIATLRASMPELPDFTAKTWQKSRTDADLGHSILEGKGKFMLPMKDKIGSVDVKQMVTLVRGFNSGQQIIEPEPIKTEGPILKPDQAIPSDLLSQELAAMAAGSASFMGSPSGYGPLLASSAAFPVKAMPVGPEPIVVEDLGPRLRAGANIFRQFCMVCHGPDGTGSLMRPSMPPIPDFTTELFHRQHTDAQIRVSILEGKGTLMPANRGRITEEQARDLAPYIRSFGPASLAIKPGTSDKEFDKAVKDLEKQLDDLHKEMQKLKGKP